MTKLEAEVRRRERRRLADLNRKAPQEDEIYRGAMRVLLDAALIGAGLLIGFNAGMHRAHAATIVQKNHLSATWQTGAPVVGQIPESFPEEVLPEAIDAAEVATMPDAVMVERVGEEHWEYLGRWKTTGYCSCRKCNGRNAGRTASGAPMIPGRTIAVGGLPFGTVLRIGDREYVVEDRGVRGNHADILYPNHRSASNHGVQFMEVWIRK